jgi:hypothetical protein
VKDTIRMKNRRKSVCVSTNTWAGSVFHYMLPFRTCYSSKKGGISSSGPIVDHPRTEQLVSLA